MAVACGGRATYGTSREVGGRTLLIGSRLVLEASAVVLVAVESLVTLLVLVLLLVVAQSLYCAMDAIDAYMIPRLQAHFRTWLVGDVLRRFEGELPGEAEIERALGDFRGDVEQVPPMYSAVKKDGVPLHRLARQGQEVERDPKWVLIERFEINGYSAPELDVSVVCTGGTYVRVLAADLGEALGCGAHLGSLRRLRSGSFGVEAAHDFETLEQAAEAGFLPAVKFVETARCAG